MKKRYIGLLFAFVACFGGEEKEWGAWSKNKLDPVSVVSVAPASLGSVSAYITTNATVESEAQADVLPQTSGRVLKVFKDDGDTVRKGEVLAILENASLDANAQRAQAELAKQEAETQKLRALYERGAISKKELSDAEYLLSSARTSATEATASFGETKLRAPFDGVIAAREIRVGETAGGGARAFQVVDLNRLSVVASLPERDMGKVKVGQRVSLVSAYDTERSANGAVARLSPVIDATSGTFRVTVNLDAGQETLRPGQFVEVNIEVERREQILTVPKSAVVYEDGLPIVLTMVDPPPPEDDSQADEDAESASSRWGSGSRGGWGASGDDDKDDDEDKDVVKDTWPRMSAKRVGIEIGLVDKQSAQILSGVEEGAMIVVVGQENLMDGASIRTPEMIEEAKKKDAEAAEKDKSDTVESSGDAQADEGETQ